jgi:tetratricopeptide (TPR) repeat protein
MYELQSPLHALNIFKLAEEELEEAWMQADQGMETLYYFVGRETLFLSRDGKAAETARQQAAKKGLTAAEKTLGQTAEEGLASAKLYFTRALSCNMNYARAHIGLGNIHFLHAQAQTPEERLAKPELRQTIEEYKQALAAAPEAPGAQIDLKARIGLAMAYRLQGEAHFLLNQDTEANACFELVIQVIDPILGALAATAQYRTLAQAYLTMGRTYTQQAEIQKSQNNVAGSIAYLQKAREVYAQCKALNQVEPTKGVPGDKFLLETIISEGCQCDDQAVEKTLNNLQGG